MSAIYFSLIENENLAERELRIILTELGLNPAQAAKITKLPNGKPKLETEHHTSIGFSRSNARFEGKKIVGIACVEDRDIGIDIELWSRQPADEAFLETVASREDTKILTALGRNGYDAGLALWVIKEAALKCTGDVMLDPRSLSVEITRDGLFRVSPSKQARAPHPEIDVRLMLVKHRRMSQSDLLLGLALARQTHVINGKLRVVKTLSSGWEISDFRM